MGRHSYAVNLGGKKLRVKRLRGKRRYAIEKAEQNLPQSSKVLALLEKFNSGPC